MIRFVQTSQLAIITNGTEQVAGTTNGYDCLSPLKKERDAPLNSTLISLHLNSKKIEVYCSR